MQVTDNDAHSAGSEVVDIVCGWAIPDVFSDQSGCEREPLRKGHLARGHDGLESGWNSWRCKN